MDLAKYRTVIIQILLFIATFFTCTLTGADWIGMKTTDFWSHFQLGLPYSISFLAILTVHEFGHFFMAKRHGVASSLPYFIPIYFGEMLNMVGTMGAFITMKSKAETTKQIFDIGVAGPLAGFILAVIVLFVGFSQIDGYEYLYKIHPEYRQLGNQIDQKAYSYDFVVSQVKANFQNKKEEFVPEESYQVAALGDNLFMYAMKNYVFKDKIGMPNAFEMYHYPLLLAGYLALFFTALNLMPIGQLDGGHILYGLIGSKRFNIVSPAIFLIFVFFAGLGIIHAGMNMEEFVSYFPLYGGYLFLTLQKVFKNNWVNTIIACLAIVLLQMLVKYIFPSIEGYLPWMLFAFILGRVLGVYHPEVAEEQPLDLGRKILGWLSLGVFIVAFTPQVLMYVEIKP